MKIQEERLYFWLRHWIHHSQTTIFHLLNRKSFETKLILIFVWIQSTLCWCPWFQNSLPWRIPSGGVLMSTSASRTLRSTNSSRRSNPILSATRAPRCISATSSTTRNPSACFSGAPIPREDAATLSPILGGISPGVSQRLKTLVSHRHHHLHSKILSHIPWIINHPSPMISMDSILILWVIKILLLIIISLMMILILLMLIFNQSQLDFYFLFFELFFITNLSSLSLFSLSLFFVLSFSLHFHSFLNFCFFFFLIN